MPRYWFRKSYADFVARLRVPSGFLLVAAFAYFSAPDTRSLVIGIPVSILGLMLRTWAAGHLAKNERLATGGPYAYLRNPLYMGTLLVAAGLVIASRQPLLAIIFAAVFVLVYLPVIELEEQHLRELFPDYEEAATVEMGAVARGDGRRGQFPLATLFPQPGVSGARRLPGRSVAPALEGVPVRADRRVFSKAMVSPRHPIAAHIIPTRRCSIPSWRRSSDAFATTGSLPLS
jgi:protein-S-isoprenylcysteine O-methyltransferase Ste14